MQIVRRQFALNAKASFLEKKNRKKYCKCRLLKFLPSMLSVQKVYTCILTISFYEWFYIFISVIIPSSIEYFLNFIVILGCHFVRLSLTDVQVSSSKRLHTNLKKRGSCLYFPATACVCSLFTEKHNMV